MRATLALAPLLLVSCSALWQQDEPAPRPAQDAATLVAEAIDEERVLADARDAQLRATLDTLAQQLARLDSELSHVREDAAENAAAALSAESAAASSQRLLILVSLVAALSSLAAIVLAIVVVWQAVVLRRAQRAARDTEARAVQDAERAAMASARGGPAPGPSAPAPGAPGPGGLAPLRKRPLP